MPRVRTGFIGQDKQGRWFYRYQYTDASGKRLNVRRLASSEGRAKTALRKALDKLEVVGDSVVEGERLRFRELASTFAAHSIIPARYIGDRKIAGRRSIAAVELALEVLKNEFANRLIKDIKHHDLEVFKLKRLDTPKSNEEQRSIASVNRELELMRTMMRFSVRSGWLMRSPFEMGPPLISKSDETRRERVLSRDEEKRLLAQCTGRRSHLRPLLIAALDTGMRRGELFKLTWDDVDLTRGVITIKAMNSKTARARTVGITPRLHSEFVKLWKQSTLRRASTVFGYDKPNSTIKTVWAAACKDADIDDFRFHDCRHSAITRMIEAGMPTAQVMKISGHTQQTTFQRYVNMNDDAVRQAALKLHHFNVQKGQRGIRRVS